MKKGLIIISLLLVLILLSGLGGCNKTQTSYPSVTIKDTPIIEIKDFSFNPSELSIKVGESIIWTNLDSAPHTITSISGDEIKSNSLNKGETYLHEFNQAGTFEYYCSLHPSMKGKIIVK